LPASVSDALAKEKLAGNVLVPADAKLYASTAGARKDGEDSRGRAMAMRVVADRGDVVEVSTGAAQDCVGGWGEPYDLRVFVARAKLIPRAKAGVTKTFSDGSAVAIDRGAPVDLSEKGLRWDTSELDAIPATPEQLVLAVSANGTPSALPPASGERLLCENDQVMTRRERADEQQRQLEARRQEREALRERRLEELRAIRAREAAERERKAKAAAAKTPPPAPTTGPKKKVQVKDLVQPRKIEKEPYISDRELGLDDDEPWETSSWRDDRFQPWCGIGEPYRSDVPKPPAPAIDGRAVAWPYADDVVVTRSGAKYFADVEHECGRVRMAVTREGLRDAGGVMGGVAGGIGGGQLIKVWVPSPGNVTWRDGTPAGTYAGGKRYHEVVEEADRICVQISSVNELVCHDKRTAKTEMVPPWSY
jgi:hypothetical protein